MFSLFGRYFIWHYGGAFADIFGIWKNFFWFVYNYFSMPVLAKTFFAPWRRITESYKKGFDPEAFFTTLALNTISRLVGMFVRALVLVIGAISLAVTAVIGAAFYVFWIFAPVIVVLLIVAGLKNLF